jgi:peptidoglycan-associated lipoprotein
MVVLAALYGALMVGCQTNGGDPTTTAATETGSEFREAPLPAEDQARVEATLGSVYFDYDQAAIRQEARPTLRGNAELISQHDGWGTVVIEGHCDERGSEEYNVALGDRRAAQVKQYLVDLGVPAQRMQTVSFGESRPAVNGFSEEAFRYNRRSDFKVASQ